MNGRNGISGKKIISLFSHALVLLAGFALVQIVPAQDDRFQVLGAGSCGLGQAKCHVSEGTWWDDDAHKAAVDNLYAYQDRLDEMAIKLKVAASSFFTVEQSCMNCHGTVISGNTGAVDEGVSCESCHGAGSAYKDPHSEGDPSLGRTRPGYLKALDLGLIKLEDHDIRAKTCVDCHYINDEKLINASHKTGARFPYHTKIKAVAKHWAADHPLGREDKDRAPFQRAKKAKGPIPEPPKAPPVVVNTPQPVQPTQPPPRATPPKPKPDQVIQTNKPAPQSQFPKIKPKPIQLEPFPEIPEDATPAEILAILKARLAVLFEETKPGGNP